MRRIAPSFGISDVGLAKLCRRVAIPLPPPGYWAKIRNGKRVRRPSLPEKPLGCIDPVSITASGYGRKVLEASLPDDIKKSIDSERDAITTISVPTRVKPHSIIQQWELEDAQSPGRGHYRPHRPSHSSIEKRRLRFLSVFFREIERRGGSIEAESRWKFALTVAGEKLRISIDESLKQEKVPTTDRWAGREWRMENQPTGLLRLSIEMYFRLPIRKQWHDSADKPLERQLREVIVGLLFASATVRAERLASEKRERNQALIESRRLANERRLRAERSKLNNLFTQAVAWKQAGDIRQFIAATLRANTKKHPDRSKLEKWAEWARNAADSIDPLCEAKQS